MEDMSQILNEFSKIVEKDGIPENLKDIINNFNNNDNNEKYSNKNNTDDNDVSSFNINNIDIQTFLKLKSALDKINSKDNPNKNLLLALKPYLKEDKKEKLDQYMQLLNISTLLEIFKDMEGDNK